MLKTILEPQRELPIVAAADIVVLGGGPGGLPAAIAAARRGMRVLLIERYGFLGGLATAGLVAPILGHTASNGHTPIVEGLLKEMTERMHALGGAPTWEEACQEWGVRFDAEAFKVVADRMVREANVELLLHTFATDVVVEAGAIKAVIVESKSGRQAVVGGSSSTRRATRTWPSAPERRPSRGATSTGRASRWGRSSTSAASNTLPRRRRPPCATTCSPRWRKGVSASTPTALPGPTTCTSPTSRRT